MKTMDYAYHINGRPAAFKSLCRIQWWKHGNIDCVVATELSTNPGPSVTNSAEDLWTTFCTENGLDIQTTRKFEYYPNGVEHGLTVDGVNISFDDEEPRASWYPVTPNQFYELTGKRISELNVT